MKYRTGVDWKSPLPAKYDACWWTINGAKTLWKNGEINITFNDKMKGISIYIFGSDGGDKINPVKTIIPEGKELKIGQTYKLNMMYDLIVMAIPSKESGATDFSFGFWIEGE